MYGIARHSSISAPRNDFYCRPVYSLPAFKCKIRASSNIPRHFNRTRRLKFPYLTRVYPNLVSLQSFVSLSVASVSLNSIFLHMGHHNLNICEKLGQYNHNQALEGGTMNPVHQSWFRFINIVPKIIVNFSLLFAFCLAALKAHHPLGMQKLNEIHGTEEKISAHECFLPLMKHDSIVQLSKKNRNPKDGNAIDTFGKLCCLHEPMHVVNNFASWEEDCSNFQLSNSSSYASETMETKDKLSKKNNALKTTPILKSGTPIADGEAVNVEEAVVEEEELMEERLIEGEVWEPRILTVPLRIISLRGSVPTIWIREFTQSQGKQARIKVETKTALSEIFGELTSSFRSGKVDPKSSMAADLVTLGDAWLSNGISSGILSPLRGAEKSAWFQALSPSLQNLIRRDAKGNMSPLGEVYGAPYRWGSTVIAFRKDKLTDNGIPLIQSWKDLWRPELRGRVAMVDSTRDVVGITLKSLGHSINIQNFEQDVPGGRAAVAERFNVLKSQVRLFDNTHHLKALAAGDVWVTVGWSSDVVPFAQRSSNIAVVTPSEGTSLWADLWTVPSTTKFDTLKLGGRIRGPSPLASQWVDFCLQPARAKNFLGGVYAGAHPADLHATHEFPNEKERASKSMTSRSFYANDSVESCKNNSLEKSEFFEPLSQQALEDYRWLLENSQGKQP